MPTFETGPGIKLSYTLHLGDFPDTIVLLHGLGANKETFKEIVNYPELAEKSILAVDHVGHGDSSSPEDFSYTMLEMAEHVKKLVDETAPTGKIVLVLHSMGGAIGIFLAKLLGDRIKGIIFTEGNLDFDDCFFSNYIITRHTLDEWVTGKYDRILEKYRANPDMVEYSIAFGKAGALTLYKASEDLVKVSKADELLDRLVALGVPVIGVYGEENRGKYPSEARFREHFPVVFTPGGHNMMLDDPDAFYLEVSKFIKFLQ
jgi:pimeloyl-ACP methyl ester carboxylesterase